MSTHTYVLKNNFLCYGDILYSFSTGLEDEIFCNGSRYFENKELPPVDQLSKEMFLQKISTHRTIKLDSVFIFNCTNNWTNKFFHFLTDVVLKTQMLDSKLTKTVLLSTAFNKKYFNILVTIIKKLGFEVILAEKNVKYLCSNSFLLSSPVELYGHISRSQITYLNNIFSTLSPKSFKRIYLSRKPIPDPVSRLPQREILNESILHDFLRKHDFMFVYPDEISIEECSSYIRGADVIISSHGSQLTNIIFAKEGTKVLEILPENYFSKSLACYRAISSILKLKYCYINGLTPEKFFYNGPRFKNNREVLTSNMLLTNKKLDLIYKGLLQSQEQDTRQVAKSKKAQKVF